MTAETIAKALDERKTGRGWTARKPGTNTTERIIAELRAAPRPVTRQATLYSAVTRRLVGSPTCSPFSPASAHRR
jgi:hypothetical protein